MWWRYFWWLQFRVEKRKKINTIQFDFVFDLTSNLATLTGPCYHQRSESIPTNAREKKNSPAKEKDGTRLKISVPSKKINKTCFAGPIQTNNPTDTNKLEQTRARAIRHITSVLGIPIENNKGTKMRSKLRNAWILTIPVDGILVQCTQNWVKTANTSSERYPF